MKRRHSPTPSRVRQTIAIIAISTALSGIAAAPALAAASANPAVRSDPYEGMNRAFFSFHMFLDRHAFRPLAIGYKRIMPRFIRTGLHNAFSNIGEPVVAINDALQGHGVKAGKTVVRFVGDSTFGLAGLFDVATPVGLPHHDNDF